MARYAAGDDAMFAELYRLVTPGLTRFIDRRLGDKSSLPDIVQETMFRVHRARGSFTRGAAVMPWVLAIAHRQLINEYRSAARERKARSERAHQVAGGDAPGAPPSGEEVVAAKQTARRLRRALAAVSEPQRAALRLVRGEGLSHAEAARVLGTSPIGVRLRTHRACRVLAEALRIRGG
jgi:RNA polymerase sigma-70 factor (ECF subfamily)